jgi:hypothetical protein
LVAIITSVALVVSDIVVAARNYQNTNSSPTTGEMPGMTQTNSGTNMGRRRGRRARRRAMRRRARRRAMGADMTNANMTGDANMSTDANANMTGDTTTTQDNANMAGDATGDMGMGRRRRGRRGRRGAAMDATTTTGATSAGMGNENTSGGMTDDLSGTYTGTVNMPDHNMSGAATLTVTSNSYTLTGEGMSHSGAFIANTTRGYTAVTMELGPTDAGQTPTFISLRARRLGGGGLSLMSVPGERRSFSFSTAGGGRRGGRRRGRRGAAMSMPASDTTTTDTTTTTTDTTTTDTTMSGDTTGTTGTRRRSRRGRRGRRGGGATNTNTMDNTNTNTNTNTTP